MKYYLKILVNGLFVIIFFTTGLIALSTAGVKTIPQVEASVTQTEVIKYLQTKGYFIIAITQVPNSMSWSAHTILKGRHYTSFMRVEGNRIVGNEDVAIN